MDTEAAAKEEQDLLARRDALLKSRARIREEQARLVAARAELLKAGGDTTEVDKQAEALKTEETALAVDEDRLIAKFEEVMRQRREMLAVMSAQAGPDPTAAVAAREGQMAGREKGIAGREDSVARREAALAERERALAVREKETCGVAATPTTIIQTVDAKGSKYTKRDVEPVLKQARSEMAKKGVLASDLPAPAQGLEREATRAMAEGDFGQARFAAAQLLSTVSSIKVDRAFISAKIGRLSAAMKGRSLEGGKQGEVDKLFSEATSKYGDGEYASANRRLNQIWAMISS